MEALNLDAKQLWAAQVRTLYGDRCAGCGSEDRLAVVPIRPFEAGGRLMPTNGSVLCRACRMAVAAAQAGSGHTQVDRRPVNFWISRTLYERMSETFATRRRFASWSALVRYMMGVFLEDPTGFDDLGLHQDAGSDVRITAWVDPDTYPRFRREVDLRGNTVTDTLKSLILLYETETSAAPQTAYAGGDQPA